MNRWNRFVNWMRDQLTPMIRFKSSVGNFTVATPVVPSVRIRPKWLKAQTGEHRFAHCPGMMDYLNAGYIITAHTDIHITANEEGSMVLIDGVAVMMEDIPKLQPAEFNYAMIDGMLNPEGVEKCAWKVPLPWTIYTKRGYSAYLLPALMHADYHDKIQVIPGVVHSDKYHTTNFVFVPLKECEFTIPAGTPLLQMIPYRREDFNAVCGKATERERDEHFFNMPSRLKGYYRKFLASRQKFGMSCPYDHRD